MAMVLLVSWKTLFLENFDFCVYPTPTHNIYFMVLICFTIKHYSRKGHNMQTSNCHLSKRMPPLVRKLDVYYYKQLDIEPKNYSSEPIKHYWTVIPKLCQIVARNIRIDTFNIRFFALDFPFNISSFVYCAAVMVQIAATNKCQVFVCLPELNVPLRGNENFIF